MVRHRTFTSEFKAQVVLAIISGAKSAAEISREHPSKPQLLSGWKATFLANAAKAFGADAQLREAQARIAEPERLVGRQALELEVAKKALHSWNSPPSRNER